MRDSAMITNTNEPSKMSETNFTAEEARALEELHRRYETDRDLFSERELAHLRFLRSCINSGRLCC